MKNQENIHFSLQLPSRWEKYLIDVPLIKLGLGVMGNIALVVSDTHKTGSVDSGLLTSNILTNMQGYQDVLP